MPAQVLSTIVDATEDPHSDRQVTGVVDDLDVEDDGIHTIVINE